MFRNRVFTSVVLVGLFVAFGTLGVEDVRAATAVFQEGSGGYASTVDTYIKGSVPASSYGTSSGVEFDSDDNGGPDYGLLRFDNIIGSGAGEVPAGSIINLATLTYVVSNQGNTGSLYEASVDWNESVTYNTFGGDAGVQGDEYGSLVASVPGSSTGTYNITVTTSIAAWSASPSSNKGWIFIPGGTDGIAFRSSEYGTASQRPKLTVDYTLVTQVDITPSQIDALVGSADVPISVAIPPGSNDGVDVTVWLTTNNAAVAVPVGATGNTLEVVFLDGAPTQQNVDIDIVGAGSTTIDSTNDAGLGDDSLTVNVTSGQIGFTPASVEAMQSSTAPVAVTIPLGRNSTEEIIVTLNTTNAAVAEPLGAGGSPYDVTFPMGGSNVQMVTLDIGTTGTATISTTNLHSMGNASLPVDVSTSFHFTVTADPRSEVTRWNYVCAAMNTYAGGPGAFHIGVGDIDPLQPIRDGIDTHFGFAAVWYPIVGNHEEETSEDMAWIRDEYNNGNGVRVPLKYFTNQIPGGPASSLETTYSWDYGNAHFIVLNQYWDGSSDTGTDGDIVPALYSWLATDLAANTKPAIFVFGHEPAYPFNRHVGDSLDKYPENRDAFWALLESYDVEAFFCGHTHVYNRYQPNPQSTWQVDCGNAGNDSSEAPDEQTFADVTVTDTEVQYDVWQSTTIGGSVFHMIDTWTVLFGLKIRLNPTTIAASANVGEDAGDSTFTVGLVGGAGTMNYTITTDETWLDVVPASGDSSGEEDTIIVEYTTAALSLGLHTATITVSSGDVVNSPQTIDVTLTVIDPTSDRVVNGDFSLDSNSDGVPDDWNEWHADWCETCGDVSIDAGALKLSTGVLASFGVYQEVTGIMPGHHYVIDFQWKGTWYPNDNWYEVLLIDGPWSEPQADEPCTCNPNFMYAYDNPKDCTGSGGLNYPGCPLTASFDWTWGSSQNGTCVDDGWNDRDGVRTASGTTMTVVLKAGSNPNGAVWFDDVSLFDLDAPAGETNCTDGVDNDTDGFTDCADTDCDSDPVCHETGATECSNGIDDDGDGLTDCCDDECAIESFCGTEVGYCADGIDNDCDGLTDCDDSDCDSDPVCHETGATACSNGLDDDGDGLTDCCDNECDPETNCLAESVCDDGFDDDCDGLTDCDDTDCDSDPVCHETGAVACSNGIDDDNDGLIDCCDDECSVESFCGAEVCDDTIDNDCDGLIDCADTTDCPEGVPPCDGFTLTITPVTGGSATGAGPYPTGTEIPIVATADGGYHFVNWTGDTAYLANTTAESTTITLFNHYTIQANFALDVTAMYEVYTSAMPGGSVTAPATSPQSYAAGTTSIPVTAVPDANYAFVAWVGDTGALANPSVASTTITVLNSDVSVQAKFAMATPSCGGPCDPPTAGSCQTISRPLGPDGTVTVCATEIASNSASGTPACCGLDFIGIRVPGSPFTYLDTVSFDTSHVGTTSTIWAKITQDDGQGPVYCTDGSVTITNGDPSIEQGASASLIVDEDSNCPLTDNEVYLTAIDPEDHALSWSILSGPSTGSASFVGGVDTGGSVTLCYDPNDSQTAGDSFQVEVADIAGATDTITVNVSVTPAGTCQKPVLDAAVSRKTHIGAGDWDIDVGASDIESRSSQLGTANPNELKIIADFDPAVTPEIDLLGGSDVTTDNGTVSLVTKTGPTTLEIDITGLADVTPYSTFNTQVNLAFPGVICLGDPAFTSDSTLCIRVIVGDYDNLTRTNFTDFALVKNAGYLNQLVDTLDKARADFDCSGRPNFTDFSRVKNAGLINQTAPACPVPPIGP